VGKILPTIKLFSKFLLSKCKGGAKRALEIVNAIVDVKATLSLKLNKTVPSDHSVLFSLHLWNMTVPNDRTILSILNLGSF
jgi:hypothetical protein